MLFTPYPPLFSCRMSLPPCGVCRSFGTVWFFKPQKQKNSMMAKAVMARFAAAAPPAAAASGDGRNVAARLSEGDGRAHRLTRGSSGRKTSGAKSKKAGGTLPYSLLATIYKGATGERPPQLDAETGVLTTTTASGTSPTGSRRTSTRAHAPPLAQCRGARHRKRGRDLLAVGRVDRPQGGGTRLRPL